MSESHLGRVEVSGHSIAYRRAGEGPALLLLHGFLCDSRVWRRQMELAERFTVIAWDAPGAGASSDPTDGFTMADWAATLASFLDALGVAEAHVLGLSWGGLLAQELYRAHPSRVRSLVLADTYAGWKGSLGEEAATARLARCERESLLRADEFVRNWVPVEFFTEAVRPEVADEMAAIVRDFHPGGFRLMARALAEGDTRDLLTRIAVPTLLLWGDGDRRSPLEVGERFRVDIPGSRLQVIEGAGHVSNMERPDAFNDEVRRFCSSSEAGRGGAGRG